MDIKNKTLEKIFDRIAEIVLVLLASLLSILVVLLDQFFGIQQTISKLAPILLVKIILLQLVGAILLVAYIIYSRPKKKKFIRYNDLLWLADDPRPFCLPCNEKDKKKEYHMHPAGNNIPPRYKCPHCGYYPKPSKHPNDPDEPQPPKQRQPRTMIMRGWVTGWKD